MKTGKAHRVPLSRQALDLLREARDGVRGGGLVFPGSRPGTMLGDKVMTQALRHAGIAASGPRVPVELQGLGARVRRGRGAVGVRPGTRRELGDIEMLRNEIAAWSADINNVGASTGT